MDPTNFDHWGENPQYPVSDWQSEVRDGWTRLGYWDWVDNRIDNEEPSETPSPSPQSREIVFSANGGTRRLVVAQSIDHQIAGAALADALSRINLRDENENPETVLDEIEALLFPVEKDLIDRGVAPRVIDSEYKRYWDYEFDARAHRDGDDE